MENVPVKQAFLVTNATNVQKRFSIECKNAIEVINGDFISNDRFLLITIQTISNNASVYHFYLETK